MKKNDKYNDITSLSYDEALQECEEIIQRLENEKLPIDRIISESRRVAALIKHCKAKIAEVGKEVDEILTDLQEGRK